jgi:hypothetical protein
MPFLTITEHTLRPVRCAICWDQGKTVMATHTCSELKRPLCSHHASFCKEDGHWAIPLGGDHGPER